MALSPEARTRLDSARQLQTSVPLTLEEFSAYRKLLQAPGLTFDERRGSWLAARYEDVQRIVLDPITFSSQRTLDKDGRVDEVAGASILGLDPPRHRQLRQLLAHSFTQKRVAKLEARVRALTNQLLDRLDEHEPADIVDSLAFPLPVTVIAELLGVPMRDIDQFREWAALLLGNDFAVRANMFARFADYFDHLIDERRNSPQDDLISDLLRSEVDGDRLTQRDVTSACTLLLIAGHETTASLIPIVLWCLDEHPDARQELSRQPELLPGAIEESLRLRGVIHYIPRVVTRSVAFDDCRLQAGDLVLPMFAAANLDARHFPDPDHFDVRRSPNRHFGFGHGIHLCLGASLARLEATIAIRQLLDRFPALARDRSQELELRPSSFVYSLKHFHVRLSN